MDMYKKMYFHLFNSVTDALEENNIEKIKRLLIKAQQETEEIYVSWEEKGIITEMNTQLLSLRSNLTHFSELHLPSGKLS